MDMKFDKRTSEENLRKIAEGAGLELTEGMSKDEIYNLLEAFMADEEQDGEKKSESDSHLDSMNPDQTADPTKKEDDMKQEQISENHEDTVEKKKAVALKQFGGYGQYAYAGPTIRNTALKENAVFRGTLEDVLDYLSDELEEYPEAMELIVPVNQLAQYKQKKEKRGNAVYNKYKAIASASSKKKQ